MRRAACTYVEYALALLRRSDRTVKYTWCAAPAAHCILLQNLLILPTRFCIAYHVHRRYPQVQTTLGSSTVTVTRCEAARLYRCARRRSLRPPAGDHVRSCPIHPLAPTP